MSGSTRIAVGIIAVIVLAAIVGYVYLSKNAEHITDTATAAPEIETADETDDAAMDGYSERIKGTTLEGSDAVVRDVVATLSQHPEVVVWLANEDLVRRFVAAVHNIAEGEDPRAHLDFMKPRGAFKVLDGEDGFVVDGASWDRYDLATEVFVSIDSVGAARLLTELGPLIDEAHREIAPPGTTFRATVTTAIDRLLDVPLLDGTEELDQKVVTYVYRDETLESLPDVERQLLRMGPDNVARIQAKLVELKTACGL